ncbi:MAG TPA: FAD-binding oxidoreductase [Rhodanobacteraceae bacterium]|nr:FAD-binding oxidoreductase [Rhodanobacteraceae bacterium]
MSEARAAASWYRATATAHPPFPPLAGRSDTDIAIVGAGFAGLNTALGLAERGVRDIVLLEQGQVGFGASGRNGGFVFGGYSLGEEALVARLGDAKARALYLRTVRAVGLIRSRIDRFGIPCDPVDAGVIWANWFRDPAILRERQRFLAEHFGVEWEWIERAHLRELLKTERYGDGLIERNAFHMHPLNYAIGLAQAAAGQGVAIHEHSAVRTLVRDGSGWLLRTDTGEVRAERVVLSCGGYLAALDRRVDRAVLPIATYVMVTEPLGARLDECMATRAAVYDTRFAFDYYRPLADTRLLWGGRISVLDRAPESVKRLLMRDLMKVFPQLDGVGIDYAWSGLMSYARHQMPQLGTRGDGLWWAQAFGGHGVSSTTALGEVLAAALAEDDPAWRDYAQFGLDDTLRPLGFLGAQANYWWQQGRDALRSQNRGQSRLSGNSG